MRAVWSGVTLRCPTGALDFVMQREFEEFKVRVNGLVAESRYPPTDGWVLPDGTPWPGNNWKNHEGIIQVGGEVSMHTYSPYAQTLI